MRRRFLLKCNGMETIRLPLINRLIRWLWGLSIIGHPRSKNEYWCRCRCVGSWYYDGKCGVFAQSNQSSGDDSVYDTEWSTVFVNDLLHDWRTLGLLFQSINHGLIVGIYDRHRRINALDYVDRGHTIKSMLINPTSTETLWDPDFCPVASVGELPYSKI